MSSKYDRIGKNYNQTRSADPYLVSRLSYHLQAKPGNLYLDIGCGTGNYTRALYQQGQQWIGMDPSLTMLQKAAAIPSKIAWQQGSAEATGLQPQCVQGILCTLTIHHWQDLNLAFQELYRVAKAGAKMVMFTSTPAQMKGYWLNHYFPKMLERSIKQMPSLAKVQQALAAAGFTLELTEKYFVRPNLEDKFLYCGKQRPELYLDEQIRAGISSFADLAIRDEVARGLIELRQDIKNGQIHSLMQSYEQEQGDYLFLVAKKPECPAPSLHKKLRLALCVF